MKIEGDDLVFSTGKRVYANNGIIGLGPDLDISGGYDQGIYYPDANCEDLSKQELIELADHMITKWQEFKVAVR